VGGYEVKILFGSIIFYTFLAFILTLGASTFLLAEIDITEPALIQETGNPIWDWLIGSWVNLTNIINVLGAILINPFTGIGFLSWFSIALMIINIYTIIRLVRGGG